MWYIIITTVSAIVGVTLLITLADKKIWAAAVSVVLIVYGLFSALAAGATSSEKKDIIKYEEACLKAKLLQQGDVPLILVGEYVNDIEKVNRLIERSAKYHDHWYLSLFYYKEIGKLEPIVLDSARIYFKQPIQDDESGTHNLVR